jgi:hypothetical protein
LRYIPDAVRVGERLVQAWREVNPGVPVMLGDIMDEPPVFTPNNRSSQTVSA